MQDLNTKKHMTKVAMNWNGPESLQLSAGWDLDAEIFTRMVLRLTADELTESGQSMERTSGNADTGG